MSNFNLSNYKDILIDNNYKEMVNKFDKSMSSLFNPQTGVIIDLIKNKDLTKCKEVSIFIKNKDSQRFENLNDFIVYLNSNKSIILN